MSAIVLSVLLMSPSSFAMNRGAFPGAQRVCSHLCDITYYAAAAILVGVTVVPVGVDYYRHLFLTKINTKRISLKWKAGVSQNEKEAFLGDILGTEYKWRTGSTSTSSAVKYFHVDVDENFASEAYGKLRDAHARDSEASKLEYVVISQTFHLSDNYDLSPGGWNDGHPIFF
jgi:hypothetical protein